MTSNEFDNLMTENCTDNLHSRTFGKRENVKILCLPCLRGNKQIEATGFCKNCEDPVPFCEYCVAMHTRQRANKNHEICTEIGEFTNSQETSNEKRYRKQIKPTFCDPCLCGDKQIEATHFCKTCKDPEPLCKVCAQQHTHHKASKHHEISDDLTQILDLADTSDERKGKKYKNKIFCDPCLCGDKQIDATHFCITCEEPEPLCEHCAQQHTRHKSSRHHEISDDLTQIPDPSDISHERKDRKQIKPTFCDPCLCGDKQIEATHFCKTCEDPEPLCEVCAQQHTRHKASRHHEISDDLKQLSNSADKKDALGDKKIFCDPCLFGSIEIDATHFCKTCEDPEPMCEVCAQLHTRQRATKHHKIDTDLEQFYRKNEKNENHIFCDPCLSGNIQSEATHFCKSCEDPEPMCEVCAQLHARQKATRHHEINSDLKQLHRHIKTSNGNEEKNSEKQIFCDPCLIGDIQNKATHFCKDCIDPEPMCKMCAHLHTRQKITKGHEISHDLNQFTTFQRQSDKEHQLEKRDIYDDQVPGAPSADDIKPDFVKLIWENPNSKFDYFQVRYKLKNVKAKWKTAETNGRENFAIIEGLMADTEYTFQVRGVLNDQEGPYGPTNDIKTKKSLATTMVGFGVLLDNSISPPKYQLPVEENKAARNENARTRQLILGNPSPDFYDEKTIMLVGATGSGKSTMVDGIINYIMGVRFEDPFRFTVVTLENEERKNDNQALSQTEWITEYKIYPTEGSRLDYTLNIIDTPGFGDTRGIQRDNGIVEQIRFLFSAPGEKGVLYIDAVCFIVKAPDARLTVGQKYIFHSIMSLFGKDVESNICTMVTFADGANPPVFASLDESKLPFGQIFTFNNSALFAENGVNANNTLAPMFWEMGCKSFEKNFQFVRKLTTKSLIQTKNVLDEREQLRTIIANVRPQVSAGLSKLSELQEQLDLFKKHKNEIEDNENFEYTINETRQEKVILPRGEYVTNCLECHVTCHEGCTIKDGEDLKKCPAMDSKGHCTVCIGKCFWNHHKNTPYIFKYVTVPVRRTYAEMKERYNRAIAKNLAQEKCIEKLTHDVHELFEVISYMMKEMNRCKTRLMEIALRPDPLSTVEHIDMMIMSENSERQPGYNHRIKMLEEAKRMSRVDQEFDIFSKYLADTKEMTKSLMGRSFEKGPKEKRKAPQNIITRVFELIQKMQ